MRFLQVVIPGSHKATFYYPHSNGSGSGDGFALTDPEAMTVTANAGDLIIMPLRLVHGAHIWTPVDRDRRMMFYTYAPQDVLADEGGSAQEMMEQAAAAGVQLEVRFRLELSRILASLGQFLAEELACFEHRLRS